MDIIKTRIEALRAVMAGTSQKDFANQHGLDASYLSQILNGHRNLGEKAAANLEEKIGLPAGTLVSPSTGAAMESAGAYQVEPRTSADVVMQMLAKHGKGLSDDAKAKIAAATKVSAAVTVDHDEVEVDFYRPGQNGDEVWIAHYDVRGAMGGGQIPDDYPEMLQDVRVSPQHLRSMGVEFKEHFHLKVVTGWGQSMAPTIKHRDPLLVDVSIREFVGDGIYLFSWGGHLYIKRLQMKGADHFKMISDNKHHDPEEIRVDETYIQARVLLVWNANLV